MKSLIQKYKHIWILSYGFIYLSWFFYLEKTVKTQYHVMHVSLDDYIPYNEYFIIPYLFWFVYVSGAVMYFFFVSKQEYYRLCTFLFTGMTISLLICTFFPNGTDLRVQVDPQKNFCSFLVSLVHSADTSTNVFPSIHVYNSLGVHAAIMKSNLLQGKTGVRRWSFVLMIAICLSTMFLKQHSVMDVTGAMILAYLVYSVVYGENYAGSRKPVRRKALG